MMVPSKSHLSPFLMYSFPASHRVFRHTVLLHLKKVSSKGGLLDWLLALVIDVSIDDGNTSQRMDPARLAQSQAKIAGLLRSVDFDRRSVASVRYTLAAGKLLVQTTTPVCLYYRIRHRLLA